MNRKEKKIPSIATEIGPTVAIAVVSASSSPALISVKPVSVAPTLAGLKRHLPS
jgi:hypothetical protein